MAYEQETIKKIPPIIVIVALLQLIFVIAIIVTIITIVNQSNSIEDRNSQPSITLDSHPLNEINLPNNYIEDITHSITDAIESNTSNFNVPNSTATIRTDSINLKSFERQQFNALSFTVDIPSLEQSYQVYYKYPSNLDLDSPLINNPRAVLCIEDSSQTIYSDFKCQSSYPDNTRERIVKDYVNFLEFNNFTIAINSDDPHTIDINPVTEVSDSVSDSYVTEVKTAISSLGVSPNLFKYHIVKQNELNYDNSF